MSQTVLLDMPTLTAESIRTNAAARGFMRSLLARVAQVLTPTVDPVRELLERAKEYEATQPSFAAELRAAAERHAA